MTTQKPTCPTGKWPNSTWYQRQKLSSWFTTFEQGVRVCQKQPLIPSRPTFCRCAVCHQVSDASGSMQVTAVKDENPFLQGDLLSDECFILDHGLNNVIFVWKGLGAVQPDTCRCSESPI